MRYIIAGDRECSEWHLARRVCAALPPGATVALADGPGPGAMVERILTQNRPPRARAVRAIGERGLSSRRPGGARAGDIEVLVYVAEWDRYRGAGLNPAGAIRARRLVADGGDMCIVVGPATDSEAAIVVAEAERAEIPVLDAEDYVRLMRSGEEAGG